METKQTFCRICEASCGLKVTVDDDRIVEIKPDKNHVATQGYGCVKGLKQHRMYTSPDRLLYPLMRQDGELKRASWDDSLADIGGKVRRILDEHGPDSIAMYIGTAAGFGVLHPIFAQGFMQGVGSTSNYASATQDCANKFAVAHHVYGFAFTQPFPDLDNTECLIIVGANPAISKWSFLQVPNPIKRLREMEARGAKIFIVDPRRTETAKVAGEHVFIRPNTDVFFYLSFLNELLASGGVDRARVAAHMTGFEELARVAEAWPPERTAEVTRIPAETLRAMVAAYRKANGASLYCSTGVNMGINGTIAFWLQEAINAISGNLDRKGGTLVGQGIIDFAKFGKKHGLLTRQTKSRIGGFTQVNDAYPGGILADEILTPGDRQVRALFVTGGNPLITMANSERLREAFESLDLLVVLDILPSETASVATHVLPCTSPFQRPDLPFVFPLMLGMQSTPYLQATEAIVPPQGEQRDEATIYVDIAKASGVNLFDSAVAQRGLEMAKAVNSWRSKGAQPSVPQEFLLSSILRVTKQGSFKQLLGAPHGRKQVEHKTDFLTDRMVTDDGKLHLAPDALLEQTQKLEADFEREIADKDKLKLITRRAITTHNSWTHNFEDFVAGDKGTNYLYMHPDDAARVGVEAGDLVDVSTATATVRIPVRMLADLMPGTVAMPHGWGHQGAKGLSVASKTTGVNVNLLAADGPDGVDPVSGMAHLTGFNVDVTPAAGPLNAAHWSGMEQPAAE